MLCVTSNGEHGKHDNHFFSVNTASDLVTVIKKKIKNQYQCLRKISIHSIIKV